VTPEIATVPDAMSNTRLAWLPLTVSCDAPGPLIVRLWEIDSSPVVRVMVAPFRLCAKSIVSPLEDEAIASRSDPVPLSLELVTVIVLASASGVAKVSTSEPAVSRTLDARRIALIAVMWPLAFGPVRHRLAAAPFAPFVTKPAQRDLPRRTGPGQ
jgi:hypothetical protein